MDIASFFRSKPVEEVVTVAASADDVALAWRNFLAIEPELTFAQVRFLRAPGGRGTEVQVRAPDGPGRGRRLKQALRHVKQIIETGEVVHAGAPEERP
jgi:hypothetical protein